MMLDQQQIQNNPLDLNLMLYNAQQDNVLYALFVLLFVHQVQN
jgi:hypothetical protein